MEEDGDEIVRIEGGDDHDDDGRTRTGTVWTAIAHAITATTGTAILALPWSFSQMGWAIGPIVLLGFSLVTYYTAILLCDCYRSPDPIHGRRNYTYMHAVRACLVNRVQLSGRPVTDGITGYGARDVLFCGIIQYAILWGTMVGFTITTAISMGAVKRSHCFHNKGHDANCKVSGNRFLMIFGAIEAILTQFPNMEKVTSLSVIAMLTSFAYSFISTYLCISKFASNPKARGTLMNFQNGIAPSTRVWHWFQALGNIAFAYTYSMLLIEIQDTLKSPPPENKTMKQATVYSLTITTLFYMALACIGYLAFGNNAPGNILTGFYEPLWLIDVANLSVIIHLIASYQVFAQPLYATNEKWLCSKWPNAGCFNHVYTLRLRCFSFEFTLTKLIIRPIFVILTTLVAMMFPFFNAIVGLLGAISFWPLTLYFPVNMYISQNRIKLGCLKWYFLQGMSIACLIVTIISVIGSIADIVDHLRHAQFFNLVIPC